MKSRLWYPQLDTYDTIRRMSVILAKIDVRPLTRERLYICDFYLANPPLLHKTHMPRETRKSFMQLSVPHPDKSFLNYPPPPLLFSKMAGTQKQALQNFIGRELLQLSALKSGHIVLSDRGRSFVAAAREASVVPSEYRVCDFICREFAAIALNEPGGLYNATGLRRA